MIKSPCNNICKLNNENICIGCKRSLDEIASWSKLTDVDKLKILEEIKNR
jgi:predicted Fe-S protein YdhL (DUF1289 family)